jgi:transitional endoplasmic reticulum ATPase
MPLEGSALEEIIDMTEGYSEEAIAELIEKLGKGRTLDLEEIKTAIVQAAEGNTGASVGIRRKCFIEHMNEQHLSFTDPARNRLAITLSEITEGFVGSDLESMCREAGMLALREDATIVTRRHFEEAQKKVHPMMNERLREYYKNIQQHFKGGLPKQVQPPEYQ